MPDPIVILTAMGMAAAVAAAMLGILGWPWREGRPTWVDAGGLSASPPGFFSAAGSWKSGLTGLPAKTSTVCWLW